jgi:hypothetical protein
MDILQNFILISEKGFVCKYFIENSTTYQKTVIFILVAVRTRNLTNTSLNIEYFIRSSSASLETGGSFLCSQGPSNGPYLEELIETL